MRYVVPQGEALAKARELAVVIAKNTPDTNWRITNLLPRINDLSHDDGLFVEYLNSNIQRLPETAERLREVVLNARNPQRLQAAAHALRHETGAIEPRQSHVLADTQDCHNQ